MKWHQYEPRGMNTEKDRHDYENIFIIFFSEI